MAKTILSVFGGLTIVAGFLVIIFGALAGKGEGLIYFILFGSGFLVAGAPLLGFARVIELLERIDGNTKAAATTATYANSVVGHDEIRKHIKRHKPAFSTQYIYETNIDGDLRQFASDGEAVAYVSSVIRSRTKATEVIP